MRAGNSKNHEQIIVSELHRLGFIDAQSSHFDYEMNPFVVIKFDLSACAPNQIIQEMIRQTMQKGINAGKYELRSELQNILGVRP